MIDKTERTEVTATDIDSDRLAQHIPPPLVLIVVGDDADELVCLDDTCLPPGAPPRALP